MDFRKNAEHLMCELTTEWILESAQSFSVCTYIYIIYFSEGSGMLIGDPLGEGSNASSTDSDLWRVENSFLRMRGSSDAPKGAACS